MGDLVELYTFSDESSNSLRRTCFKPIWLAGLLTLVGPPTPAHGARSQNSCRLSERGGITFVFVRTPFILSITALVVWREPVRRALRIDPLRALRTE
jgi:hypothetical protein